MQIRRVVTGHDGEGHAVFADDGEVEALELGDGGAFHLLWGADEAARFPDDGSMPDWSAGFPSPDGYRFLMYTLAPNDTHTFGPDHVAAAAEPVAFDAEAGMHTTATIDFEVVLSGEVTLELDDGAEVVLRPFDTVVQNGTRHRWINRGTEPATMAIVLIGAHHEGV